MEKAGRNTICSPFSFYSKKTLTCLVSIFVIVCGLMGYSWWRTSKEVNSVGSLSVSDHTTALSIGADKSLKITHSDTLPDEAQKQSESQGVGGQPQQLADASSSNEAPAKEQLRVPTSYFNASTNILSLDEQRVVQTISQKFSEEMAQVKSSPDSLEYHKAWNEATERADAELQLQLGSDLFNQIQFQSTNAPITP